MRILDKYKLNEEELQKLTTKEDIDLEVNNITDVILDIETKINKKLVGNRNDIKQSYVDCLLLTKFQTHYLFSRWIENLMNKYSYYMTNNTYYDKIKDDATGDTMYVITDPIFAVKNVYQIINDYIKEFKYEGSDICIFDTLTKQFVIKIECEIDNMPKIISSLSCKEKAQIKFIVFDSLIKSYVVGMFMSRGRVESGYYKDINGKVTKIKDFEA